MSTRKSKTQCCALGAIILLAWPAAALAYMGPTLGFGIVGTIIALVVVLLLSLFSFVVMPLRRRRDRNRREDPADKGDTESPARKSKPADGG